MPQNIPSQTQAAKQSDWLAYESEGAAKYSRSNVAQAVSVVAISGTVVAKNTNGEIVEFTGAAGAANVATGIALNVLTTDGTTVGKNVCIERHARIVTANLVWKAGVTAPQKAAALASLALNGVVQAEQI